jgi:galactose mutarotase-like enzyme
MKKLENQYITANINAFGAELCSLRLKQDGTEYIWQADSRYWGRHAPVLFPIVGRLVDNEYLLDNKVYNLSQHGFARDMEFECIAYEEQYAEYRLLSGEKTLNHYPSRFELVIGYRLKDNTVIVEYKVTNKDDNIMYFSIGAHPGFRCPLLQGECFEDYYLEFSQQESAYRYLLENGLLSNQSERILNKDHILPLSYDLFANDALVFKGLKSDSITLKSKKSSKTVKVKFEGFPYQGIWSKPDAPFICIEPWYGIADTVGERRQFSDKEGICSIQPGESFACQYSISIH